jgi:putative heme-binding domain-containing protein
MQRCAIVLAALVTLATALASAQGRGAPRSEPRAAKNPLEGNALAISNGGAMFRTRCAGCHGPDALAYLKTVNAVAPAPMTGDATNGERIFRANCSSCHMVNGRGGQLGPDLSRIGSGRPRAGLLAKLRGTTDFIRQGYEPVTLVTKEGERIRGVKKNEDEFSIQIMDTRERLQGFIKANLTEFKMEKQSLMPVYGPDRINNKDLDDLLRYLTGLRAAATSQS